MIVRDFTALLSGSYWTDIIGQSSFLTYSFAGVQDYFNDFFDAAAVGSVEILSSELQNVVRQAFATLEQLAGLRFFEVGGVADINLQWMDFSTTGSGSASGFAYYPGDHPIAGDVFLNTDQDSGVIGTLLHEIGHALGLKHPHSGDPMLADDLDNGHYTIMSYNRGNADPAFGPLDVDALISIYGESASFATHLTNWSWDPVAEILRQVGTDDSDDLMGTVVGDHIYGRAGSDLLSVAMGNDVVWAGSGDDTVYGGPGRDLIGGGEGNDSLYGGEDSDTIWGGVGNDTIIEYATISGSDVLGGGAGNDEIYGGGDNDTVYGAAGDDVLLGNDGNNLLFGGDGNDQLVGGDVSDVMWGGSGFDTMWGDAGADTFGFVQGSGADYVGDFDTSADRIDLSGYGNGIDSFADLAGRIEVVGSTIVITLSGSDRTTLGNVGGMNLSADDFIF